jgi:hypothetical protein
MASYMETANTVRKGLNSPYYDIIMDSMTTCMLSEEVAAIMALILENCKQPFTDEAVRKYVSLVETANYLMPSGELRSRQVLVTLALQVGFV